MINKKALFAVLAIALVAVVSIPAMMQTWVSCTITMHAGTGDTASIGQYTDCLCTQAINSYNWGALSESQTYEMTVYVKNTGNKAVDLFFYAYPLGTNAYIPIGQGVYPGGACIYFESMQVKFDFSLQVIEGPGVPCQTGIPNYQSTIFVPVKFDANWAVQTNGGISILPGKCIKVDVMLTTHNLVGGGTYDFKLVFDALTSV